MTDRMLYILETVLPRWIVALALVVLVVMGGVALAGPGDERKQEVLFGLEYADVDTVGATGEAFFGWAFPFGDHLRVGPTLGMTYISPDNASSFNGYSVGGLVAWDFGAESAFFVEGTVDYALDDLGDVVDHMYGVGGGYKIWSGNVLIKVKAAFEQVEFEVGGSQDRVVTSIAIGFGR